ncbi:MAG: outer membrane protein assembly factor BamD [Candidatus Aminicenantaceae bacterium]
MKKLRFPLVLLLLLVLVLFNCGGKKTELTPDTSASDEELYNLGEKQLKRDPEKARLYFRQVIDSFPKSFYAQRAKIAIADSYFNKGDEGSLILAASEYREFISLYPYSPRTAYSQNQIGMTFYKKALKPGKDQTKTWQALSEFKKVITNYPMSEEANQAQEKINDCEERLAQHISEIGIFYYKRNAFRAAVSRLNEVITSFPNFSMMDKVYYYLADSYYKWKKTDQSVPYFTKLISDFPQSKYAENAQKKLEEINKKEAK